MTTMSWKSLTTRVARVEQRRNHQDFQAAWDAFCDDAGWPRFSIGNARCLEDLLAELRRDEGPHPGYGKTAL